MYTADTATVAVKYERYFNMRIIGARCVTATTTGKALGRDRTVDRLPGQSGKNSRKRPEPWIRGTPRSLTCAALPAKGTG